MTKMLTPEEMRAAAAPFVDADMKRIIKEMAEGMRVVSVSPGNAVAIARAIESAGWSVEVGAPLMGIYCLRSISERPS